MEGGPIAGIGAEMSWQVLGKECVWRIRSSLRIATCAVPTAAHDFGGRVRVGALFSFPARDQVNPIESTAAARDVKQLRSVFIWSPNHHSESCRCRDSW